MATVNRLVPFVAVGLFAAMVSAFADGADSPSPKFGPDDGMPFFSGLSPAGSFGLTPSRNFSVDFDWGSGLRSELRSDLTFEGDTDPSSAPQLSLLGNVIYDFAVPDTSLNAHVGAGFGVDSTRPGFGPVDDLLTYQFMASTEYALLPELKFGAEYRFLGAAELTPGIGASLTRYNPGGHSLLFTLRYDWGAIGENFEPIAGAPLPALIAALPSEEAVKPPDPGPSYEVFFEVDRAVLTSISAMVIRRAAESAAAGHTVRITVSGLIDTVGMVIDKSDLAIRRAAAVKNALEEAGIPANAIVVRSAAQSGSAATAQVLPSIEIVTE